jgi:hypothetical protein
LSGSVSGYRILKIGYLMIDTELISVNLIPTHYSRLTIHYPPLTTHYSPLTNHHSRILKKAIP